MVVNLVKFWLSNLVIEDAVVLKYFSKCRLGL